MRHLIALLLMFLMAGSAAAETIAPPQPNISTELPPHGERYCDSQLFPIRHGSRDTRQVAITVDDCDDIESVRAIFEIAQEYGVRLTFFPIGWNIRTEDRELWQAIAASDCEIGSHTMSHVALTELDWGHTRLNICRFQERLDEVLGYHYQVVSLRPPYGVVRNEDGRLNYRVVSVCRELGFEHVVLWEISWDDASRVRREVRNGSIILYHAIDRDVGRVRDIIPWLLEEGYELVTVRELLEFDPIETGPELYEYES